MYVVVAGQRVWFRAALRLFLEELTFVDSVGEVADAEALLHVTASQRPDLILLDAALPKPPRLAILRQCVRTLRTLHPPVYIIVLCGNGEKLEEVRTIGADAWISKAESPDRLLAALQQAAG